MNPEFPLFIVSKGRADTRMTAKALEQLQVPYQIIVEAYEYKTYCQVIPRHKVVVLDADYIRDYDTFDDCGLVLSKGPGPARNFCWDYSLALGHPWHWVLDDNIRSFYRMAVNQKIKVADGTIFRCMEDFALRYTNVGMVGPNYEFFATRKEKVPPYIANTRIYSCMLIRNDLPLRWRGRYNEDTDLSLRMLKSGWCTIQFNAFLQKKMPTQRMAGGNTDTFYAKHGTGPKSEMLVKMHPDVSRLTEKWGRIHHHVDYSRFKTMKLHKKPGLIIKDGVDEFGMKLTTIEK
jgi:hypothetical protein